MKEIKPIDMSKIPHRPNALFRFLIPTISFVLTCTRKIKIKKINCENLKGPYIVICSHASFMDFPLCAKVCYPEYPNYICSIEEFVGREWLMRNAGAYPKRKYTKDIGMVKNTLTTLKKENNSIVIYPEARYSFIGINEQIDQSIGKMVKKAGVPLVLLITYGDFIYQPQWNKQPTKNNPHEVIFECIVTKEEVETMTADEIQERINEKFVFDEYRWQLENKIKVKSKYRAHNIHRVLYKCPHCGKDYSMRSKHTKLWCEECGVVYEMNEYGQLECMNREAKFTHAPDWYKWEREEVEKEVNCGKYSFKDTVRLEHLDNAQIGFRYLGDVEFVHDMDGIHLHGQLDNGEEFIFNNHALNTPSIHIDYDFKKRGTKKRGQAIDINTQNDTWFIYPNTSDAVVTKIHFATEALYNYHKNKKEM